jgi:hypothetical protein
VWQKKASSGKSGGTGERQRAGCMRNRRNFLPVESRDLCWWTECRATCDSETSQAGVQKTPLFRTPPPPMHSRFVRDWRGWFLPCASAAQPSRKLDPALVCHQHLPRGRGQDRGALGPLKCAQSDRAIGISVQHARARVLAPLMQPSGAGLSLRETSVSPLCANHVLPFSELGQFGVPF